MGKLIVTLMYSVGEVVKLVYRFLAKIPMFR